MRTQSRYDSSIWALCSLIDSRSLELLAHLSNLARAGSSRRVVAALVHASVGAVGRARERSVAQPLATRSSQQFDAAQLLTRPHSPAAVLAGG